MKSTSKLIILVLTFLALAANADAQSPREQLQQMVEQLQKTPTDNALREKIIKLATSIKPAPAIPEEAREPFVMGAAVLKKASDPAGASKAVDLFTQALNIAPWFADAYYNRAIAREAASQFESAIDDLKLYLGFKLTDNERREAQDKIYSLKADAQLASAKKAETDNAALAEKKKAEDSSPEAKARRDQELIRSLDGAKFVGDTDFGNGILWRNIYEIHGSEMHFYIERNPSSKPFPISAESSGVVTLKGREFFHQAVFGGVMYWQISEDGSRIQALYRNKDGEVKDNTPSNTTEPRRVR